MAAVLGLPLGDIQRVVFFKIDEMTTDLICCSVDRRGGERFFLHEEVEGWDQLIARLELLPGFRSDWFEAVFKPPFERCETVAFERSDAPADRV